MVPLPKNPVIYEINTWVWIHELCRRYRKTVTLATVPAKEWNDLAALGINAVWLMGVWERSPRGTQIAREDPDLQGAYRRALPDFTPEDVVGSPYCVRRYVADKQLGGSAGLAAARRALAKRTLSLLLDYVPNNVAPDHPWVTKHPDYLIQGTPDDLAAAPHDFSRSEGTIFAHGRDPHFPPWTDTAQLNAFSPALRRGAVRELRSIARQCDGVRCDMSMLLMNRVFERTWGARAGVCPGTEYWGDVIGAVRKSAPSFTFMAEAYWDMEWELQQQGFDYCYDKRLYDRLAHETTETVLLHLQADLSYQERMVRFIENHDEPRAANAFGPERSCAAALAAATLPGARLFHDGQLEGRRIRLPVQLARRSEEKGEPLVREFYPKLLKCLAEPVLREGAWALCSVGGWPDNDSFKNLLAWSWTKGTACRLIVINNSSGDVEGRVQLPWSGIAGYAWRVTDVLSGEVYRRNGDKLSEDGLYVGLGPWGHHFLQFARA